MRLTEYIRRMREIQTDMYDGGKPSVEELIELSRPQGLGLYLLPEQELEVMIVGINTGLDAIEKAYLYFEDEEEEEVAISKTETTLSCWYCIKIEKNGIVAVKTVLDENDDQIYVYNITDERLDDVVGALDGLSALVGDARESGWESHWVAYEDALNAIDGLAGLLTYLYGAVEEEREVTEP